MNGEPYTMRSTAVLLYGLLREYETCAASLIRHVVEPNRADLFYFGPEASDRPTNTYFGVHDDRGFLIENPKARFEDLAPLPATDLTLVYGDHLKRAFFHSEPQSRFEAEAAHVCDETDWLMRLNPYRIFSMFYNLQGATRLLEAFEREAGVRYETLIITRPDLAFYTPVVPAIGVGEVHIASGQGIDDQGRPHLGNAPVYYYKNATNGDFVPGGSTAFFNDQVVSLRRGDLEYARDIYDRLAEDLSSRVPPSPETLLYLALVGRGRLKQVDHPEWCYEILRLGDLKVQNVLDLRQLQDIDPYHPKLRSRPVVTPAQKSVEEAEVVEERGGSPPPEPPTEETRADEPNHGEEVTAEHPLVPYVTPADGQVGREESGRASLRRRYRRLRRAVLNGLRFRPTRTSTV